MSLPVFSAVSVSSDVLFIFVLISLTFLPLPPQALRATEISLFLTMSFPSSQNLALGPCFLEFVSLLYFTNS